MFRPIAFALPLLLLPLLPAQDKPAQDQPVQNKADLWLTDFEKAKAQAKAEKKDLLVDFTGSDWCGWCMKLDEEVFSQDVFTASAPKDFVLVKLDYPQKTPQPDELKEQNKKLAEQYHGAFHLGKVDTDREVELAQAFGVQGIPFCVLVAGGRPVDGFQGALPAVEVKSFLQRNGIEPLKEQEPDEPPAALDPKSPAARLQRALQAAKKGNAAAARAELEGFPEDDASFDQAQRLRTGLEWLEATLSPDGPPAEAKLAAARARLLQGDPHRAMDHILESVAADKGFRAGLARKAMLLCFLLVGEEREELDGFRRRLATLLY